CFAKVQRKGLVEYTIVKGTSSFARKRERSAIASSRQAKRTRRLRAGSLPFEVLAAYACAVVTGIGGVTNAAAPTFKTHPLPCTRPTSRAVIQVSLRY